MTKPAPDPVEETVTLSSESRHVYSKSSDAKWYFEDETSCEYGPFDTEREALRQFTLYCHELAGWRPPASPEIEAKLNELAALEDEIATIEEALSAKKATLKAIGETDLPALLDDVTDVDLRAKGVRLADGREFEFEYSVYCGIPKASRETAHHWLVKNGAEAILKNTIILRFGNNSQKIVAELRTALARLLPQYEISVRHGKAPDGLVAAMKELVAKSGLNPEIEHVTELPGATLSAWVKKQLKLGVTLPEYFGVYAPLRALPVAPPAICNDVEASAGEDQTQGVL